LQKLADEKIAKAEYIDLILKKRDAEPNIECIIKLERGMLNSN